MSSAAPAPHVAVAAAHGPSPGTKKKNKKRNKAKKNLETNSTDNAIDGADDDEPHARVNNSNNNHDLPADEDEEPDAPAMAPSKTSPAHHLSSMAPQSPSESQVNGHTRASPGAPSGNGPSPSSGSFPSCTASTSDTSAKLEATSAESEALREDVERLRKQLETINEVHSNEVSKLKSHIEETESAKEQAEEQYQTLLGRVEKIKQTLGDRLKRDRAELEEANERISRLEAQNEELRQGGSAYEEEISRLKMEIQESNRDLTSLRSRSNLSKQNWLKEKDDLMKQAQHLRSELESTSSALGAWEVIAMEERQMRESLAEKAALLEEQQASTRQAYEKVSEENDNSLRAIDGLQRALQEIQEARRKELRDLVESSEEQLREMKKRVEDADRRVVEAEDGKEKLSKEVERTAPFEKEVREKSLLIGKLRHEGIILNDHLTKALRYLKKTKPDEQVDRQIITNYLLQFLSLDRSDPKRFQILQLIAGYLAWTDEQKELAGLARPGASHNTLRLPASPFRRTPSTTSLSTDFFSENIATPGGKESLADLWAGFLERSVEEGRSAEIQSTDSRKESVSSTGTGIAAIKPDGGRG